MVPAPFILSGFVIINKPTRVVTRLAKAFRPLRMKGFFCYLAGTLFPVPRGSITMKSVFRDCTLMSGLIFEPNGVVPRKPIAFVPEGDISYGRFIFIGG